MAGARRVTNLPRVVPSGVVREPLPTPVRRLIAARGARSVGQGALVVAFALYLRELGWSATAIGATLTAALVGGAALTIVIGPWSDRRGRRTFLLAYEALQVVAALLAIVTAWAPALVAGAVIGGFGRGANGSAGPFGPLEQAWLAHELPAHRRGAVLSANAAIGFVGMAAGALLAGGVPLLVAPLGPVLAYRPLFGLSLAGAVIGFVLIAGLREPAREAGREPADDPAAAAATRRTENRMLVRLVVVNTLNGLGIGMVAPLIAYWFALRFGHGPGTIGVALAASFGCGAIGSLVVARWVARAGLIRPVVVLRGLGIAVLLVIPLVTSFALAAVLYAVRAGLNRGTAGVRQALVLGLSRERRGLAATVQHVSIQIPRAVGPLIAALCIEAGWLGVPFVIAAVLQAAYLVLYVWLFGAYASGEAPS